MDIALAGTTTRTKGRRMRAMALAAMGMLLVLSLGSGTALADGGRHHRNAQNTFTKWITAYPAMAGVVGGDVGGGTYAGEILSLTVTATGLEIDAAYHFNGSRHSFTALVHVAQTGFADGSTAVITGQVTQGWLRGNAVSGAYTQVSCTQGTCFTGTLDILRGTRADDD
ncbi:MAG: hypothetical protein WCK58_04240 [Chloroflexota bacterium]